jgi:putative transposase
MGEKKRTVLRVMVDETRRPTMLHGREKEDNYARDGRRNSSTYVSKGGMKMFYRRNMPHYQPPDAAYHTVFRLAGSFPMEFVEKFKGEYVARKNTIAGIIDIKRRYEEWSAFKWEYFRSVDQALDSGTSGPRWLGVDRVADIVSEAIHYRDGLFYELLAYTIMPNHVHLVVTIDDRHSAAHAKRNHQTGSGNTRAKGTSKQSQDPARGIAHTAYVLTDMLENLKWYTALKCNRELEREGAFWQHESYDHVVRTPLELERTILYVLNNPVSAGLVRTWQDWKYSFSVFHDTGLRNSPLLTK